MIDSEHGLAAFLPELNAAEWIALDTEADSLHAYPEKLCLIQISVPGSDVLLDPLAKMDFRPVFRTFNKHELILHGADYDLRLLRRHFHFVPSAVFDTMLGSRLLGVPQFGLNDLLSRYLGVKLEKGPQKANWARRPLTPRMETYARNDTRYLKPLADILRQQLLDKGRLQWHQECCARLIVDCAQTRNTDPNEVWRVKGSQQLEPASLAILRELWHWREKEALRVNKPPFFILSPDTMIALSKAAIDSEPVKSFLPSHLSPHRREGILGAIERGLNVEKPPARPPRQVVYRQTEAERRRMHEMQTRRNRHATQLGLDPTLIASRSMLVLLARDWDKYEKELMSWQRELLK